MKTEEAVKGEGRVADGAGGRGGWRAAWREEAIMMLTLPLRGSRSESCQLQANAGWWDAAGMPRRVNPPRHR